MNYKRGDIVVLKFPYSDFSGIKIRPAIVLKNTGDSDLITARITSSFPTSSFDLPIEGWQYCNLHKPSVIRMHKIITIQDSVIIELIGSLNDSDIAKLNVLLEEFWNK